MRLIDADKLKEHRWLQSTRSGNSWWVVDVKDIDNAPTVEIERKKGCWNPLVDTDAETGEVFQVGVMCSCCQFPTNVDDNYCPNCGAYMRGEDKCD